MLNDYLNGYTEKLSRGNSFDPSEIKIDQNNFSKVLKAVSKRTYNPYFHFQSLIKSMKQRDISDNPKYMTEHQKA